MSSSGGSYYETFVNALNQLEQDQTLFESQLGNDDLIGVQHEEIIKLGGIMCKRFQKLAEKGQSYADTLTPDFLPKLVEAISLYQNLIMPPKVFGGFCPCLKPARDGVEYDKKLLVAKAHMVSSVFLAQAALIEHKGEQHNMDSMHYADYANRMNKVFNGLADIKCNTNSEKALENARKKLLLALESVDKFVQHFGDSGGKIEFKAEALRRIRTVQELLTTRQASAEGVALPVGRRVLIKAQSSLQEIMNSAAAIAATQARENLRALEGLQKLLKKSRDIEVTTFNSMEEQMNEMNVIDVLSRLREDSEVLHSDANSKLRDAIKRWTSIKNQAQPRPVAEFKEDLDGPISLGVPGVAPLPLPINPDLNPQRILQGAGNKIISVGRFADKIKNDAVTGVGGVMGEMKSFAQISASEASNAAKKVGKALAIEDMNATSQHSAGSGNPLARKPSSLNSRTQGSSGAGTMAGLRIPGLASDSESGASRAKSRGAATTTTAGGGGGMVARSKSAFPKINLDAF